MKDRAAEFFADRTAAIVCVCGAHPIPSDPRRAVMRPESPMQVSIADQLTGHAADFVRIARDESVLPGRLEVAIFGFSNAYEVAIGSLINGHCPVYGLVVAAATIRQAELADRERRS